MKRIASAVTVSVLLVACSDAVGIHPEESFTLSAAVSPGDIVNFLVVAGEHPIQGGTGQSTLTAGRTIGTQAVPDCTGDAREYPIQEALVHDPRPTGRPGWMGTPGRMGNPGGGSPPKPSPSPGGAHRVTLTVLTPTSKSLPPGTKLGNLSQPSICTVGDITYDVFLAIVF
ncbi:MAG: hypothetical protein ACE5HQ_06500 [Gemmatimonadota bacterium]